MPGLPFDPNLDRLFSLVWARSGFSSPSPQFHQPLCSTKTNTFPSDVAVVDHNGQLNLADVLTIQDVGGVEHLVHNGPLLLFRVRNIPVLTDFDPVTTRWKPINLDPTEAGPSVPRTSLLRCWTYSERWTFLVVFWQLYHPYRRQGNETTPIHFFVFRFPRSYRVSWPQILTFSVSDPIHDVLVLV